MPIYSRILKDKNQGREIELLVIDLTAIFISGLISFGFDHSVTQLLSYFGPVCAEFGIFTGFYFISFLIWKTYDSFGRNMSFEDFAYTVAGLATGCAASAVWIYNGMSPVPINYHDIILQSLLALIIIRATRSLFRLHYHYYSRRSDINGSYGLSDIALLNMELSDLLSRDPITINREKISKELAGKCIMVTGAAGSIGSALTCRIAKFDPCCLILVDQAETPLHDLEIELARNHPSLNVKIILCDVTDTSVIGRVFELYHPEIVFHAAAYKHVGMMEHNPVECILNNVGGTVVLANLAVKHNCSKFILISTDKAVNPISIMGCSKRICEIYCQSIARENEGTCAFITTRFGNVLGSNGSVIPLFREQIRRGGPVTVTHPDVIRYFMLIEEACDLVLEASTLGHGGEIFVFDMGAPVKIYDLAKKMIKISRRSDIKIEVTGLKPGEKLFEEVLADREKVNATVNGKIWIAKVKKKDFENVKKKIDLLLKVAHENDVEATIKNLHEIVDEFKEPY